MCAVGPCYKAHLAVTTVGTTPVQRDGIYSVNPITLFTHFKTNTKSIDIHRVLRCSVLLKKSKHCESNEMG